MNAQEQIDLIVSLKQKDRELRQIAVRDLIAAEGPDALDSYVQELRRLRHLILKLETARLQDIAAEYDYLSEDFKKGIKRLGEAAAAVDSAKKIINAITAMVDNLARLIALMP